MRRERGERDGQMGWMCCLAEVTVFYQARPLVLLIHMPTYLPPAPCAELAHTSPASVLMVSTNCVWENCVSQCVSSLSIGSLEVWKSGPKSSLYHCNWVLPP